MTCLRLKMEALVIATMLLRHPMRKEILFTPQKRIQYLVTIEVNTW